MPFDAPVTTATLPFSLLIGFSFPKSDPVFKPVSRLQMEDSKKMIQLFKTYELLNKASV
jgi:hypothetical protein